MLKLRSDESQMNFLDTLDDAELVCRALNMISEGPTYVVASGPDNDQCVMPMGEAYDMQIPSRIIYADGRRSDILETDTERIFPQLPPNQFTRIES